MKVPPEFKGNQVKCPRWNKVSKIKKGKVCVA